MPFRVAIGFVYIQEGTKLSRTPWMSIGEDTPEL
jgi:hypothetical protein